MSHTCNTLPRASMTIQLRGCKARAASKRCMASALRLCMGDTKPHMTLQTHTDKHYTIHDGPGVCTRCYQPFVCVTHCLSTHSFKPWTPSIVPRGSPAFCVLLCIVHASLFTCL